jgi:3-dehydro-L-gulonate 2-dehydrogenase
LHTIVDAVAMEAIFYKLLIARDVKSDVAKILAATFTENSIDGVYSHGVNRFSRFIDQVEKGVVDKDAKATLIQSMGSLEQWDGHLGPGVINAYLATDRAIEIAKGNGIGLVGLANTNHWMRAGTYGWYAAKKGYALMCFTNTTANMILWNGAEKKIGNNPMVIAVPYGDEAIVLDMAMSQYSYGKLELYDLKSETTPTPAGYNLDGQLTSTPRDIIQSERLLPMGYWKGAGLSLMIDILVTALSKGRSCSEISKSPVEYGLSQLFIAIDLHQIHPRHELNLMLQSILKDYKNSEKISSDAEILYPSENVLKTRAHNLSQGIPVIDSVWAKILALNDL